MGGCSYLHRVCCRPRVADKCDSATQWRDLHERALIRRHAKGAIKLPAAVLVGDDVAPLTRALPCKDHERSRRPVSHLAVAASAVSKWICRQCDVATAERVGSNRWQHGAGVRTATTVECQPLKPVVRRRRHRTRRRLRVVRLLVAEERHVLDALWRAKRGNDRAVTPELAQLCGDILLP